MTNLRNDLAIHAELKARLLAQFPAEDEESLADTLEGISDLNDKLVRLFESASEDQLMVDSLAVRIGEMHERKARLAARYDSKRALIAWAMQEAGIKKIENALVTLSLRNMPPSVVITDEAALPSLMVKVKTVTSPDKAAIKAALEAGIEVAGASLSNGSQTLSARVK